MCYGIPKKAHGAAENCMFSSLFTVFCKKEITLHFDFLICCRFPMLGKTRQERHPWRYFVTSQRANSEESFPENYFSKVGRTKEVKTFLISKAFIERII